jgi:pimeloyl-ACP methyl ester carboxylesterase
MELEIQRIHAKDDSKPTIVFLHEGLGSVSTWRGFPQQVVERTLCPAVVYSRHGYGNSEVLREPRTVHFMHDEALRVLPELLDKLAIHDPILLGHSDGGSISLIYAGEHDRVKGLILLAPHVFVEDIGIASIAAARRAFETTNLAENLARHHKNSAATFWGWSHIWLHPDFRNWNIEQYLPRVNCPVLAIQGLDDQYGTLAQLDAIARQAPGSVEQIHLKNCRHSPHRDQREEVLKAISGFVARLTGSTDAAL